LLPTAISDNEQRFLKTRGTAMLDLRRLKVLREVARRGSFSAAATELMFSPSAVSQQIAQLEREVGMSLVERKSNGIAMTPAGELLLGHANAILARATDAEEELRQLGEGTIGRLRVAAFASATAALLPDVIPAFRSAHPRVEITLVEQDRKESLEGLRQGELDLAVVFAPSESALEGVLEMPLLDERIDVLLPLNHRLAGAPTVTLEELCDEPWADCSGEPVRDQFGALGVEPNVVFLSDHHRVVEGIVAAGVAIAFVPRLAQPPARRDVIVKAIAPPPPVRPIGIAVRAGVHQPAVVTTMIDLLREAVASRDRQERSGAPIQLHPTVQPGGNARSRTDHAG
jgi:DNA-binding transcriptional LysR family regulator